MKLRNYKVIGKDLAFQAADDKIAAIIIASIGDFGFTDAYGLDKFPATWSESEWEGWLGSPLPKFLGSNGAIIAPVVAALRSACD